MIKILLKSLKNDHGFNLKVFINFYI
jgi:hypothetical protein